MITKFLKHSVLAVSVLAVLTGCGGSDDKKDEQTPTPPATTVKGLAVDGPLAGSQVTFNDCQSQTTVTDMNGRFNFPAGCTESLITISGGIDTTTDLPFSGELKSPRKAAVSGQENTVVASPITTLIQAAGGTSAAATQIANALGLQGVDLLNIDPMQNQAVYAKTVAVQQLVEQIQDAILSLGGTTTPAQLNTQTFAALQAALTSSTSTSDKLTDTATIKAAIVTTVEAVKDTLPTEMKGSSTNVAQNLGNLTANIISENVKSVETKLHDLPAATFNAGTESIKTASQETLVAAKQSVAIDKVVDALSAVLTQTPSTIQSALQEISSAVATPNATSSEKIATAISNIADIVPSVNLNENAIISDVQNANSFYADYLKLNGFNVQSTDYTISALSTSLSSPISVSSLNNLLVGIDAIGAYASKSVVATTALHVSTASKNLIIISDRLNLTFGANGKLSAATIPNGAKITVNVNSTSTSFNVAVAQDVLSGGKIALNTTTLGKLSASLANQLNSVNLSGQTVNVTAVISADPKIAISEKALATQYTVGSVTGYGASAKFKVN